VLLEVGRVVRPHGLRGEVVVELVTSLPERLAPGSTLARPDGGALVVDSAQLVPGRQGPLGGRWLVRFAGVDDRSASEALSGAVLLAEPVEGADGLWVHELIGARVVELSGRPRGTVVSVEANPASDLLVLDSGALVPLRFVVSSAAGEVVVDVPEGLFEL
jgi:16S rRNA processing protein RimM